MKKKSEGHKGKMSKESGMGKKETGFGAKLGHEKKSKAGMESPAHK